MNFKPRHTFHIPVMGIGYSIDSPVKVAHLGIISAISTVDDILMEKVRAYYCRKYKLQYTQITDTDDDFRAKRTTAYLNLVKHLVEENFSKLKKSMVSDKAKFRDYLEMFPLNPENIINLNDFIASFKSEEETAKWIEENLVCGSIDVNIMTKLDKPSYDDSGKLPREYNEAHSALRGFANSDLHSAMIFSAGLNTNLFSYMETLKDFYPDENGYVKKKIILKVSDYRSAFVQAKILAKKGLWVAEYRIESGLYCGGHCFPTPGYLMGPILEEFKNKRKELYDTIYPMYADALKQKNIPSDANHTRSRISVQFGVTTYDEHCFLLDYYQLDSIGWGTPFLLVPEVTNVDHYTLELLKNSTKDDLFFSDISPVNVPFSNIRFNSMDNERDLKIRKNMPGSLCPKKHLSFNTEFTEKEICTASREYQEYKIKQLKEKNLPTAEYDKEYEKIVIKSCICVGLGTATLMIHHLSTREEGKGVTICPGPNIAYFNKIASLREMIDHIYDRKLLLDKNTIPHVFIRELEVYINYLKDKIEEAEEKTVKQLQYFTEYKDNLLKGITYYKNLFAEISLPNAISALFNLEMQLEKIPI